MCQNREQAASPRSGQEPMNRSGGKPGRMPTAREPPRRDRFIPIDKQHLATAPNTATPAWQTIWTTKIEGATSFEELELALTQIMDALSAEARPPQRSEGEQVAAALPPCPTASPTSTSRKWTEEAMQQTF